MAGIKEEKKIYLVGIYCRLSKDDVAYGYTGKIIRLEAKKQDDMIMLTFVNDERRKWVFTNIENNRFHWENITVKDDGEWGINAEIYAERII